jgi:hypothetical protein
MRFAFLTARFAFVLGWLLLAAGPGHAGIAPYTDRGKIDFDTAMALLNPYGTWAKVDSTHWAFTPLDHGAPYTNGRWIYTEFGWTWLGNLPHSWLTEHYGFWKRGENHLWSWFPGPYWLPQAVEIRAAPDAIGWRSAEVDDDGNFVESPTDRYTKTDEWTFVSLAQFAGPITPAIIAKPADTEGFLEESIESTHSYFTYRRLDRPGPHPADFINLGDGRMFAPMTAEERMKAQHPAAGAKTPVMPSVAGSTPATVDARGPNGDQRQVVYWVTMSLPTIWTKPPRDAKRDEIFFYRPDFWQDQDGIERRIALWLNPGLRSTEALHLQEALDRPVSPAAGPGSSPPAAVAIPAEPAEPGNSAFASPFEQSFTPTAADKTPSASTKSTKLNAGAPVAGDAAAPVSATVAAPAGKNVSTGTNAAPVPASP